MLHPFGKFADMIEVISDLHMTIVNISAHPVFDLAVRKGNTNLFAVTDAKLLFIFRGNETNPFFRAADMLIKPIFYIAVAIEVVFALVRIETAKISILLSVYPYPVIILLVIHFCLRRRIAVFCQRLAIKKNISFLTK